jgi:hypothetical protein
VFDQESLELCLPVSLLSEGFHEVVVGVCGFDGPVVECDNDSLALDGFPLASMDSNLREAMLRGTQRTNAS